MDKDDPNLFKEYEDFILKFYPKQAGDRYSNIYIQLTNKYIDKIQSLMNCLQVYDNYQHVVDYELRHPPKNPYEVPTIKQMQGQGTFLHYEGRLNNIKEKCRPFLEQCFPNSIIPTRRDEFDRFKYEKIYRIRRFKSFPNHIYKEFKDLYKNAYIERLFEDDPNFETQYELLFIQFIEEQFEEYNTMPDNQITGRIPFNFIDASILAFIQEKRELNEKFHGSPKEKYKYTHHLVPYFELVYANLVSTPVEEPEIYPYGP